MWQRELAADVPVLQLEAGDDTRLTQSVQRCPLGDIKGSADLRLSEPVLHRIPRRSHVPDGQHCEVRDVECGGPRGPRLSRRQLKEQPQAAAERGAGAEDLQADREGYPDVQRTPAAEGD